MLPLDLRYAGYTRVGGLAVALYQYLETMPFEQKLVAALRRREWRRISPCLVFFSLMRYATIASLVTSNIGYFHEDFTVETCRNFYMFSPVFKVVHAAVSQAILTWRAHRLAWKSKFITYTLLGIYVLCLSFEGALSLSGRREVLNPSNPSNPNRGICTSIGASWQLGGWMYYTTTLLYDVFYTCLCAFFLWRKRRRNADVDEPIIFWTWRMLTAEGMWHLLVITAANFINLILSRFPFGSPLWVSILQLQNALATLNLCIRGIMLQNLMMLLYRREQEERDRRRPKGGPPTAGDIPSLTMPSFAMTEGETGVGGGDSERAGLGCTCDARVAN